MRRSDRPRVFGRALTRAEIAALEAGGSAGDLRGAMVADWDFSLDISSDRVTDTSGNDLHARTVNIPTRAMPGHNWSGTTLDFKQAPNADFDLRPEAYGYIRENKLFGLYDFHVDGSGVCFCPGRSTA